ncbi:hypothetical protein TNIN_363941 [Trichonephila inaurata madagascariensis]|uniref:Uncharacterized protein n=1 Tax=Trichonephila inaurata madagascariensis TaxID=2747483 RepID=A0A8X6YUX4_9ARAC|nr:hypothetical protein TNIN_363941 [Trichonephila inaurata madagascariensis]
MYKYTRLLLVLKEGRKVLLYTYKAAVTAIAAVAGCYVKATRLAGWLLLAMLQLLLVTGYCCHIGCIAAEQGIRVKERAGSTRSIEEEVVVRSIVVVGYYTVTGSMLLVEVLAMHTYIFDKHGEQTFNIP